MTRILATWTHTTAHEEVVVVPPDGCVDLIMLRPRAAQPYWFVSTLQNASKNVVLEAGLHYAIEWGFSDQAHMTREFVRWFGITPAKFRTNQPLKAAIKQPGLAT
jgi:hypothetical protein